MATKFDGNVTSSLNNDDDGDDGDDDMSDWKSTSLSKYSIIREAKRSRSNKSFGGNASGRIQRQQQQQRYNSQNSSENNVINDSDDNDDQFTQVDSVFGSIIPKRYSRFANGGAKSIANSTIQQQSIITADDQTTLYSMKSKSRRRNNSTNGGGGTIATSGASTRCGGGDDEETLVTYYSLLQGPNRFRRNKNLNDDQGTVDDRGNDGALTQRSMRLFMLLFLLMLASFSISNMLLGSIGDTRHITGDTSVSEMNNGLGGDTVVQGERFFAIMNYLAKGISTHESLTTVGSPQFRALDWIANHDEAQLTIESNINGGTNNEVSSLDAGDRLVQRFVLAVLYFSTNLSSSTNTNEGWKKKRHHWLSSKHECEWKTDGGVRSCDSNKRVTDISIWNNLVGTVPHEIGNLKKLQILYLARNDLYGTIPSSIGQLKELTYLGLHHNQLTGTFPSNYMGNLTKLRTVYLEKNDLEGTIKRMDPFCQLKYDAVPPPGQQHSGGVLRLVTSDCRILVDWQNPEITCSCCTKCFAA
mmetsp:Transcript_20378/g.31455  ORF Transcript_20378/g.31455 Transcript_20378/m.31455 type:complete len:528 (+) Transcript_20378:82-1665(+)